MNAPSRTQSIGQWAEDYALQHLQQHGFFCVARQYRCRLGEVDLIVQRENVLVFVEVKARSSSQFGQANEMLSLAKQKKIIKTALHFLQHFPQYQHYDYRFDFMAISFSPTSHDVQMEWIEHAFLVDDFLGV